jgi:hypothetical protein
MIGALPASAQTCPLPVWSEAPAAPHARGSFGVVTDTARSRLVLFGGLNFHTGEMFGDTWEFDSNVWVRTVAGTGATVSPAPRDDFSMVYDSVRRRTVLYGGFNGSTDFAETWEYNGANSTWSMVPVTAPHPSGRRYAAMAFDAARNQVVLFGGFSGSDLKSDTWLFNGATWTQSAAVGPSARRGSAIAYDAVGQRVVLFGGYSDLTGQYLSDTWAWNGAAWTQLLGAGPGPRVAASMCFDPDRNGIVLNGGGDVSGPLSDTWLFGSVSGVWTQLPTSGLSARRYHVLAYDSTRGLTACIGGVSGAGATSAFLSDLSYLSGNLWQQGSARVVPPARFTHAMAFDSSRAQAVVFGGQGISGRLGDTWLWNGDHWTNASLSGPSARAGHNMAFDSARSRVVLFGGALANDSTLADTWEWNGSVWAQSSATGPGARTGHVMCYDAARQRIIIFGGFTGTVTFNDTWTFNGAAWSLAATTGPSPRSYASATYDASRQRVVLFGGRTQAGTALDDAWEWDGTTWAQRAVSGPAARQSSSMAFDPNRNSVIMFGGLAGDGSRLSDTWELYGSSWVRREDSSLGPVLPLARDGQAMCFDTARSAALVFGGRVTRGTPSVVYLNDELWLLGGSAPKISSSPASRSRPAGSSVSLGIVASSSTTPIYYQWQRNNVNLANDARIVRASEDEIHRIAQLPFVRWTGRFHPAYRIDDATRARVLGEKQLRTSKSWQWPEAFNIQVFQFGPNQKAIVADRVRALGGKVIAQIDNGYLLRASLTPAQLLAIIRLDEVAFVDPWQAPQNDMDVAREIGGANYVSTQRNFRGQGVRGEVLDGGFLLTHVDFQGPAPMSHTANGSDASHGTSTYGIVFGKGISNPLATGMLPAAEQGIYAAYPGLPDRYAHTAQLVNPALAFKAVFQSNSWGGGLTTAYTTESMEMDDIIYRTDLLICQSQSNAGSTSSRPQAWAKNIVSVGGVQHQNSLARTDDRISGASTGPAADGRIKPDLCHFYDEVMTTTNTNNTADTPDFGGTSAATPIVAGHFGLLFQMWHEGVFAGFGGGASVFADRPHAATAKALMINTAFPYSFTTPYFITRVRQGWGMPDLTEMYDRRADFFIINQTQALRPFTSRSYRFLIPAGTAKFRATMVYADRAGTTSSSVHRINDLSLKVRSPAFSLGLPVYHWGNNGLSSQQFSLNFGSSDRKNTVENVFVNNPAAGLWTVEVFGDEIVQDTRISTPQLDADFALVVRATGLVSLCTADIDANGLVEAADLAAYLDAYQLGTAAADTDDGSATGLHDGGVTIDDLLYYLGRYGAGC